MYTMELEVNAAVVIVVIVVDIVGHSRMHPTRQVTRRIILLTEVNYRDFHSW